MKPSKHRFTAADALTSLRLAAAPVLLLPLSPGWFLTVYALAGLTDALDGWIARRSGTASQFGARLDSAADLAFYGVLLYRLFPVLRQRLPGSIWYGVGLILLVRLSAYCTAAVKYHRFAALHTWLNKLTGGAVFLLPYVLFGTRVVGYSLGLCALALAASAEELVIHLKSPGYEPNRKSLFPGPCQHSSRKEFSR